MGTKAGPFGIEYKDKWAQTAGSTQTKYWEREANYTQVEDIRD